jgi:catechol 2,3-dioxygenase-like lactoylglutathione lyase family enzyme
MVENRAAGVRSSETEGDTMSGHHRATHTFRERAGALATALLVLSAPCALPPSTAIAAPVPASERGPVDVRRVTLLVRDVDRSLALYRDALGLKVVYDQLIGGGTDSNGRASPPTIRLVLLRANDDFVGLIGLMQRLDETPPPPPKRLALDKAHAGQPILVINAADMESRFPRISTVPGVTVATAPTPVEYPAAGGGTIPVLFSAIWDPDGFFVEINQLRGTAAGTEKSK